MTNQSLTPQAQKMWDEMREFVRENTERWVNAGWTKEDARQRSIELLEGLTEGELTEEATEQL